MGIVQRQSRERTLSARSSISISWLATILIALAFHPARALEHVTFSHSDNQRQVSGRILVEAQDGGLLLEGRDRIIWTVQPDEILSRRRDTTEFVPLSTSELSEQLLRELPDGFRIHQTANYLICYNTSKAYAQWCGSLYEQLHRAFYTFWKGKGIKLTESEPLIAVVFRDRASYRQYSQRELGDATDSIIGFYSLTTNRITSYDLTGIESLRRAGDRTGTMRHISRMLIRPEAERTVATIIHEATHQLAFNSGLQTRFADNPLWLSEGLAIYFESPDLKSRKGWRRIGGVNHFRLHQMRQYLRRRPDDSLITLISNDQRFRDTSQADEAYAEAWSLCYHLIRTKPDQFAQYLELIRAKPPLVEDGAETRIREFRTTFGIDLQQLDREFRRAIPQWR